jgi:hypothetical protein
LSAWDTFEDHNAAIESGVCSERHSAEALPPASNEIMEGDQDR